MHSRQDVVAKARELVGKSPKTGRPAVRFRHQGRNPKTGLDCAGVPLWVAKQLGIMDFNFTAYEKYPDGKTLGAIFRQQMVEKSWGTAKVGDVLLMRSLDRGWPCHMAVLVDNQDGFRGFGIVHSWARAGGVVESHLDEDWAMRKVQGVWAFPALEECDG
jgi:hypothetical protein